MNKSPNPSNSNGAHDPHEELRQQLWELAYDLLDDEAAAELRARVKSDPAIARLYAEVRLQSDLVAAASRVNDTGLNISLGPDSKGAKTAAGKDRSRRQPTHAPAHTQSSWTNWIAIGGTVALLVLLTIGLNQPQTAKDSVAKVDEYFFTKFVAPAEMTEGLSQTLDVEAKRVDGTGVEAELEVRLIDAEGRETFRKALATTTDGRARVQLPGEVLTPGSKFEVRPADDNDRDRSVSAPLNIAPEEAQTVMLPEKPFARPGEKVGFIITKVKPFSKRTELPAADDLMVESDSKDVVQPMWTADPDSRIVYGELELPREESLKDLAVRLRQQQRDAEPRTSGVKDSRAAASTRESTNGAVARLEKFYLDTYRESAELQSRQPASPPPTLAMRRTGEAPAQRGYGGGGGPAPLQTPAAALPMKPGSSAADIPVPEAGKQELASNQARSLGPAGSAKRMIDGPEGNAVGNSRTAKSDLTRSDEKKSVALAGDPQPGAPAPMPALPTTPAPPAPAPATVAEAGSVPQAAAPQAPRPQGGPDPGAVADRAADGQTMSGRNRPEANQPQAESPALNPYEPQLAKGNRPAGRGMSVPALPAQIPAPPAPVDAAPATPAPLEGEQLAANINGSIAELRKAAETPALKELEDRSGIAVVKQGPNVVARKKVESLNMAEEAKANLPPEAQGALTYEFYAKPGTRPLVRERFLHESDRQLQIAIDGLKDSYQPGEMVQLKLRVQDEQARAVPAALGVRVWSDAAVRTTRAPLSLAAALEWEALESDRRREEAEIALDESTALAAATPAEAMLKSADKPVELPALQKRQQDQQPQEKQKQDAGASAKIAADPAAASPQAPSNAPAPEAKPATSQPFALGTEKEMEEGLAQAQGTGLAETADAKNASWRTSSSELPDVIEADNRAQVERDYEMAVTAARLESNERWQQFGRVLIWAAAGLLLVVGLFLIARQPVRMAVLVPAVGLSVVCLGLGLIWFLPHEPASVQLAWHDGFANTEATHTKTAASPATATAPVTPAPASEPDAMENSPSSGQPGFPAQPGAPGQLAGGYGLQPSLQGQGEGGGGFAERFAPAQPPLAAPAGPSFGAPAPSSSTANATGEQPQADATSFGANRLKTDNGRREQPRDSADKLPATSAERVKESGSATAGAGSAGGSGGAIRGGAAGFDARGDLAKERERLLTEAEGHAAPPDSIFWRPLAPIDDDGTVTIEFTMPSVAADYVLLIDAIGNGRMGHLQQVLHSRDGK